MDLLKGCDNDITKLRFPSMLTYCVTAANKGFVQVDFLLASFFSEVSLAKCPVRSCFLCQSILEDYFFTAR